MHTSEMITGCSAAWRGGQHVEKQVVDLMQFNRFAACAQRGEAAQQLPGGAEIDAMQARTIDDGGSMLSGIGGDCADQLFSPPFNDRRHEEFVGCCIG